MTPVLEKKARFISSNGSCKFACPKFSFVNCIKNGAYNESTKYQGDMFDTFCQKERLLF